MGKIIHWYCNFFYACALAFSIALIMGCVWPGQPTTNLSGEARPTGTLTVLRVDDLWRGKFDEEGQEIGRDNYKLGEGFNKRGPRFVPLRSKSDVAGLDGPDRVVTEEDFVIISLNSGFIKYFKEIGGSKRHGEIALVISFDAGPGVVENVLIYSAKGQTLGSFMPLDDWPVIGPVKITGDHLRIRVVMIELDQAENVQARNFIKFLSQTGSAVEPGLAGLLAIAQPIVDQIIALNSDDVVLDYRFALKRTKTGEPVLECPLLYGKYVLVLQEDRLSGIDVKSVASLSITPIVLNEMRFDRLSNRVQKVYNYKKPALGKGPIGWSWIFYDDKGQLMSPANAESKEADVNSESAIKHRREQLGYRKPELSEYEIYSKDVEALEAALLEACRTTPAPKLTDKEKVKGCENYMLDKNQYGFEYPVTQYPEAFTIIAQYPLHTHLVFSVERSLGGTETPYHEGFQAFSDYLQQQLEDARTATDFTQLSETIRGAATGFRKQNAVISRSYQIEEGELMERVCLLWEEGLIGHAPEEIGNLVSKAPVYNEIYHLTGRVFTTPDEVAKFIADSACTAAGTGENKCSCQQAVVSSLSADK